MPPRGDERKYVDDHYRSFWFFDAQVWAGPRPDGGAIRSDGLLDLGRVGAPLNIRELREIHRQADDGFKAMLNAHRDELLRLVNQAVENKARTAY